LETDVARILAAQCQTAIACIKKHADASIGLHLGSDLLIPGESSAIFIEEFY
jgi:hypothetical protein